MEYQDERQQLIEVAHDLSLDLSIGRSGNLSLRVDHGFLITPTGVANADLQIDQLVFMQLDGSIRADQLSPSSEWRFHRDLYPCYLEMRDLKHIRFHSGQGATMPQGHSLQRGATQ